MLSTLKVGRKPTHAATFKPAPELPITPPADAVLFSVILDQLFYVDEEEVKHLMPLLSIVLIIPRHHMLIAASIERAHHTHARRLFVLSTAMYHQSKIEFRNKREDIGGPELGDQRGQWKYVYKLNNNTAHNNLLIGDQRVH